MGVFWDEDGHFGSPHQWRPHNTDLFRMPSTVPGLDVYDDHLPRSSVAPDWDSEFAPGVNTRAAPCCSPPVVQYQGDLIEATFDSEPIGQTGVTDLLYINYKSPDYTGHVYGMRLASGTGLQLEAVDAELERLVRCSTSVFPDDYVLFVTADHGQCPLPGLRRRRAAGPHPAWTRSSRITSRALVDVVQSVVPSRGLPATPRCSGTTAAPRSRTSRSPCATTGTGRTSARTCRAARSSRTCSNETRVLGGVRHDLSRHVASARTSRVRRHGVRRRRLPIRGFPRPTSEDPADGLSTDRRGPRRARRAARRRRGARDADPGGHGRACWEAERLIDVDVRPHRRLPVPRPAGLDFAERLLDGGARGRRSHHAERLVARPAAPGARAARPGRRPTQRAR